MRGSLRRLTQNRGPLLAWAKSRWFWFTICGTFALDALALGALPASNKAISSSLGPAEIVQMAQNLADFDGDGSSSLFGGADCAPFTALRSPAAYDFPNNGIDEDCDGRDASEAETRISKEQRLVFPSERIHKYNILLIAMEAVRADRIGKRVRRSSLTPALDRFASDSIRFTRAFAESSCTRISFPVFMTGVHAFNLIGKDNSVGRVRIRDEHSTLATRLGKMGYRTGLVVDEWIHGRMKDIRQGYDQVENLDIIDGVRIDPVFRDASTIARAFEFIEKRPERRKRRQRAKQPFFLTLYFGSTHAPYLNLEKFGIQTGSRKPIDLYNGEVRRLDESLGVFLDALRVKPSVWNNTAIFILADHGEEFGEHGGRHHCRTCYRESTHVPLFIRVPGLKSGVRTDRVSLVDIAPTILTMVGAEDQAEKLDGRNLLTENSEENIRYPDRTVYCTFYNNKKPKSTLLRSVRDDNYFYLMHIRSGKEEIYETSTDRKEQVDLSSTPVGKEQIRRLRD